MVAPFAFEVPEIAPTEETAFNVDQLALPVASEVNTLFKPGVPPEYLKVEVVRFPILTSPSLPILIDSVFVVPL